MQIDDTKLPMVWSCVFTAMASVDLLYAGYCHLSLIVFVHKTFWGLQKSVTLVAIRYMVFGLLDFSVNKKLTSQL